MKASKPSESGSSPSEPLNQEVRWYKYCAEAHPISDILTTYSESEVELNLTWLCCESYEEYAKDTFQEWSGSSALLRQAKALGVGCLHFRTAFSLSHMDCTSQFLFRPDLILAMDAKGYYHVPDYQKVYDVYKPYYGFQYDSVTLTSSLCPCPPGLTSQSGLMVTTVNDRSYLMSFGIKYASTSSNPFQIATTSKFLSKAGLCLGPAIESTSPPSIIPTTASSTIQKSALPTEQPGPLDASSSNSVTIPKQQLLALKQAAQHLEAPPSRRRSQPALQKYPAGGQVGIHSQEKRPRDAPPTFICQTCPVKGGFHKAGCPYRVPLRLP